VTFNTATKRSQKIIKNIKNTKKYKKKKTAMMKNCTICSNNIAEEELIQDACGHCFCKNCKQQWSKPYCKGCNEAGMNNIRMNLGFMQMAALSTNI